MPWDIIKIHENVPPVPVPESTWVSILDWRREMEKRNVEHILWNCMNWPVAFAQSMIGIQLFMIQVYQDFLLGIYGRNADFLKRNKH